jgi:hypothetical protein
LCFPLDSSPILRELALQGQVEEVEEVEVEE